MGGAAVLMPKFDAAAACALIARHAVTHTILVPAQYSALLDQPDLARLASLRMACTVGSLMAAERKQQIDALLPGRLHEVYGLTEGLVTILRPADLATHAASVGRPMLGNDIRILDGRDLPVPPGEPGEIVGCTPFLMQGYLGRPDATAATLWRDPASGRDFLRSGDIGRFDAAGFLHLVDRKKDMIVSGAANIYPADIERILFTHPGIADACVIGVPHPRWDETPLALVVLRPGAPQDTAAILAWANDRLGKQQRLSAVELRESLPRNAAGKILKRLLREPYWP
jgi:acyl-CoA synthetase (AMP-forming)/AMP-acid ligase II